MLSVTLPPRNKLAVAKISDWFLLKSAFGSSLLEVLATFEALPRTIADKGTVRSPMV